MNTATDESSGSEAGKSSTLKMENITENNGKDSLTGELFSQQYLRECVHGCNCPVCVCEGLHVMRNGHGLKLRTMLNRV